MKTYRETRALLAEIDGILDSKQSVAHQSPFDQVISLICQGRHYAWAGIFLAIDGKADGRPLSSSDSQPTDLALPETRTKILLSMKVAGREAGVLAVESAHENAFGAEDRVFLERVANKLARFLSARGKYLVRKARTAAQSASSAASSAAGRN